MTFEERHYVQLLQLEQLAERAATARQEGLARRLKGALLIAMGIACLGVVAWMVIAQRTPVSAVVLGGIGGAMIAAGVIALVIEPDHEELSARSS